MDLLLQHYAKCDTLEELRNHRTAVTRECFVRRNYTDSHLDPHFYRRWFIGGRATMSQIENRQQQLDELAQEMITSNERDAALKARLSLTSGKMRPLIELENLLESLAGLAEREGAQKKLQAALDALDLDTAEQYQV